MVSIFIPTYNAEKCIGKTLRSVLQQTYRELEVWVVDDCSTDGTVSVLESWMEKDARLHLLTKERNEGFVPYSWVRVMPLLRGEFTLYLSHDDYLAPDCIEQLVQAQRETGADVVIPDVVFVNEAEGPERHSFTDSIRRELTGKTADLTQKQMLGSHMVRLSGRQAFSQMLNYDIPGFALWRTDLIRQVGMSTEAWNSDEGMQRLWVLHAQRGVTLCPTARFYYHITPSSITQGLKPYHITGLLTQRRLLRAALRAGTFLTAPRAFFRFVWQYLKSSIYLHWRLREVKEE